MKKLTPLFLITILFIVGCQPSQNSVNTAIAQTQAAIPTATFTPQPTNTHTPTNTPIPTNTKRPTATPDYSFFKTLFPPLVSSFTESQLGRKLEIADIEYDGDPSPTTLTIRINADKSKFETGEGIGIVLSVLSSSLKTNPDLLPKSIETLILREYDGLVERGSFTVKWSDFLEFSSDKISIDQLILRGQFEVK